MVRVTLEDIPATRFTSSTIKRMYELVGKAKVDEKFQRVIYSIVNHSMRGRWKEYRAEIQTILDWFRANHDYRRDPSNVELLQDPWATMDRRRFDCDDSSIWLAAAAEVLGAPARFVTVSTRPDKEPSHVYLEVLIGHEWVPIDAIMPGAPVGWAPPDESITDRKIWDRRSVGLSMEGLGMGELKAWNGGPYPVNGSGMPTPPVNWEGGFSSGLYDVNRPGVADDVSHTFAAPMPGASVTSPRWTPSKNVNRSQDPRQTDYPGGARYSAGYPIVPHPLPGDVYGVIPASEVPMEFSPDAWTNPVPDAGELAAADLPNRLISADQYLRQLEGLGAIDVAAIAMQVLTEKQQADAKAAEAARLASLAEIEKRKLITESDVPIYKKSWFLPVAGAAGMFLFKGGAELFGRRKAKYKRNPGMNISKLIVPGAIAIGAVMLLSKKKPPTQEAVETGVLTDPFSSEPGMPAGSGFGQFPLISLAPPPPPPPPPPGGAPTSAADTSVFNNIINTLVPLGVSAYTAYQQQKQMQDMLDAQKKAAAQMAAMQTTAYRPIIPASVGGIPSWLIPVGIGTAALVAIPMLMGRRGGGSSRRPTRRRRR